LIGRALRKILQSVSPSAIRAIEPFQDPETALTLSVTGAETPPLPGHVFCDRLQNPLREVDFTFAKPTCKPFCAPPSLPSGRSYADTIGYFEGVGSKRALSGAILIGSCCQSFCG
jgi:hypothetical protein